MSGEIIHLGDYCDFINGGAWKQAEYGEVGHPVVQVSNLKRDNFDMSEQKFLRRESFERYKKHQIRNGDLIIATVGSHPSQPSAAGRAAVANITIDGMLLNQNAVLIRSISPDLAQGYLCLIGRSPDFQHYVQHSGKGAANQVRIAIGAIKSFEFELPSKDEQIKIAHIIEAYDDLIENNRRRIALLEQAARLLYREWFVHFRFPGHETAKFVDGLPEGWQPAVLSDHVDLRKEAVKPDQFRSDDVHIGLEHIPRRSAVLSDWEGVENLASHKFRFDAGDIIFGKIRPYFHKVGFAVRGGVASSDAFIWRVKEERLWPLIMSTTSSDYFVSVASKTVREGSKMPRADWKVLANFSVPVPTIELLAEYNAQILPNAEMCKRLVLQNRQLTAARDLLLPRLMDGRISV